MPELIDSDEEEASEAENEDHEYPESEPTRRTRLDVPRKREESKKTGDAESSCEKDNSYDYLKEQVSSPPDLTDSEEEDSDDESEDEDMQRPGPTIREGKEIKFLTEESTNASRDHSDENNEAKDEQFLRPSGRLPRKETGALAKDTNEKTPKDVEKFFISNREDKENNEKMEKS